MWNCLFCHLNSENASGNPNEKLGQDRSCYKIPTESCKYLCNLFKLDSGKYIPEFQQQSCCRKCFNVVELVKLYVMQLNHIRKQLNDVRTRLETDLKTTFFHYLTVPETNEADIRCNKFRENLLTDLHIILKVETIGLGLIEETTEAGQVVILEGFDSEEIITQQATDSNPFGDDYGAGDDDNDILEYTFAPIQDSTTVTQHDVKSDTVSSNLEFKCPADVQGVHPTSEELASKTGTAIPVAAPTAPREVKVVLKKLDEKEIQRWTSKDPEVRKKALQEFKKSERYAQCVKRMKKRLIQKRIDRGKFKCTFPNCKTVFCSDKSLRCHIRKHHRKPDYLTPSKTAVDADKLQVEVGSLEKEIPPGDGKIIICPYEHCFARYRCSERLRTHIRHVHEGSAGKPYSCRVENCDAFYLTHKGLEIHNRREHLGLDPYLCHCGDAFKTRRDYSTHTSTAHFRSELQCRSCPQEFQTKEELVEHKKTAHPRCDRLLRLKQVDSTIPTTSRDGRDHNITPEQKFRNLYPGIWTLNPMEPTGAVYTCPTCSKVFEDWKKCRMHFAVHGERKLQCPDCPKSFPTPSMLRRHSLVHTKIRDFVCDSCGKTWLTKVELRKHEDWHCPGKRNESNYKQFVCSICGKRYQTREVLNNHLKEHAGLAKKKPDVVIECDLCDYTSTNPYLVRYHRLTHQDTWAYPCDKCDRKFRFSRHLKYHVRLAHLNIGRHECPECSYKTNSKQAYLDHLTKHTNEFAHVCDQCGNKYKRRNHLRRHKVEKHKETSGQRYIRTEKKRVNKKKPAEEVEDSDSK